MLCFFIAGLYLERKTGSLGLLALVLSNAKQHGRVCAPAKGEIAYYGDSGVNYALYAYIAIDYLFSFTKSRRNKTDLIFGGVVLALIYLAMCFSGGTATVSFKPYPYDLLHNLGHGTGFSAVRSSRCSFSCPWRRRAAAQKKRRLPAVHNTIAAPPAGSRRGCADQGPVLSKMHSRRKRLSASRYFSESSRL